MAKILILGGGITAAAAADEFARVGANCLDITVVSASRKFITPLGVVPFVFGMADRGDLELDLAARTAALGIRFVEGEVLSVDPNRRIAAITGDDVEGLIHFDYLLIASERKPVTESLSGFAENAYDLLSPDDTERLRIAVDQFRSGSIVVGLAPGATTAAPVFESALALVDRFADEIRATRVSVSAVFPSSAQDAAANSFHLQRVLGELAEKRVNLVNEFSIERIVPKAVYSSQGTAIRSDLLMLVPPLRGSNRAILADGTDLPTQGAIKTNEKMQVSPHQHIYAAGEPVLPPAAEPGPAVFHQVRIAVRNILAQSSGAAPSEAYTPITNVNNADAAGSDAEPAKTNVNPDREDDPTLNILAGVKKRFRSPICLCSDLISQVC